jgi:hypothetical protein
VKYKALKSAAHNFGHSFASGLNWRDHDYFSRLREQARAEGITAYVQAAELGLARVG